MSDHYDRMLADLDEGTLTPDGFTHRDHVGITVAALLQGDFYDALARISRGLARLTSAAGAPEKFNATLTFAFVSLIAERMTKECNSPDAFFLDHPDILSIEPLAGIYPYERLNSAIARRIPLLPEPCQQA
ncbi:hypothetical protein [Thalassovita sp.]|uniref:hypothetical protein n=1 Tax=Thalassovita sp. TaxID=1979401 RepID=UPI002B2673BB|nr:hypothetical protein [Thalassovita sp.]